MIRWQDLLPTTLDLLIDLTLFGSKKYVDFYVDNTSGNDGDEDVNYAKTERQRGAFPVYVGEWQNTYWDISLGGLVVSQPTNILTER